MTKAARKSNINEGIVLIEVDDMPQGGTAVHRKTMSGFYSR